MTSSGDNCDLSVQVQRQSSRGRSTSTNSQSVEYDYQSFCIFIPWLFNNLKNKGENIKYQTATLIISLNLGQLIILSCPEQLTECLHTICFKSFQSEEFIKNKQFLEMYRVSIDWAHESSGNNIKCPP